MRNERYAETYNSTNSKNFKPLAQNLCNYFRLVSKLSAPYGQSFYIRIYYVSDIRIPYEYHIINK